MANVKVRGCCCGIPFGFGVFLLCFALAAVFLGNCSAPARSAPSAASADIAAPTYRTGQLVKVKVLERREGSSESILPPATEGETPTAADPQGGLVTFAVESGETVYRARCVEGVDGCRAADLAEGKVRFRIEGETIYLKRPGGKELAARVVEAKR